MAQDIAGQCLSTPELVPFVKMTNHLVNTILEEVFQ